MKYQVKLDIRTLAKVLYLYYQNFGNLPSENDGLSTLTNEKVDLMKNMPIDPWGLEYGYRKLEGKRASFILWSKGSINQNENPILFLYRRSNDNFQGFEINEIEGL